MANEAVQVRPATQADLDTVVRFNRAMALETEALTLDEDIATAGARRGLSDPSLARYFIAELDAVPVGQTMITDEWSDWRNGLFWWIQSVYVEPAHRGRGVFRALYAHIRDLAQRDPNVCGLRLYVINTNTVALETYSRLGMTVTDYRLCEDDWAAR